LKFGARLPGHSAGMRPTLGRSPPIPFIGPPCLLPFRSTPRRFSEVQDEALEVPKNLAVLPCNLGALPVLLVVENILLAFPGTVPACNLLTFKVEAHRFRLSDHSNFIPSAAPHADSLRFKMTILTMGFKMKILMHEALVTPSQIEGHLLSSCCVRLRVLPPLPLHLPVLPHAPHGSLSLSLFAPLGPPGTSVFWLALAALTARTSL